jgi:hypothetical protein
MVGQESTDKNCRCRSRTKQSTRVVAEKINLKYLSTLDHPLAKMLLEYAQNGTEIPLEISPKFFSTWDFAKILV